MSYVSTDQKDRYRNDGKMGWDGGVADGCLVGFRGVKRRGGWG